MKYLSLILISVLIYGCKSDIESIQGHWHDVTFPDSELYMTLDIEDSLIYMNKYDKSGRYSASQIIKDGNNLITDMGPNGENYMSSKILLRSDTLILLEYYNDTNFGSGLGRLWIKAKNDLDDIRHDISSNLLVKVSLSIDNSSIPFDSIEMYNKWAMLNIGYPNFNKDNYPKDSLLIHANDAIGDFSDTDDYFESMFYLNSDNNIDSIVAIINADISTPDMYFDSIFYYLRQCQQISAVYRTYLNDDFYGLGLKKLQ